VIGIAASGVSAQIITSQPWIPKACVCSAEKVDHYFAKFGFRIFRIDDRTWGHFSSTHDLVILDAHAANVFESDGIIVPIDVVIGYPGSELLAFIKAAFR
jgi:hypothetical protein